ncbi:MAG: polysaccharide deacetylase family protein [Actinomycetota bacterium]|nr:polysaccharide deacetylase family protein [Actinomycetota bacterium]
MALQQVADRLWAERAPLVCVATDRPVLALTIDDGPHPDTTPALLEVLGRHQARATFFLIGERAARHPELVRAIAADGHQLGNHLWQDRPTVRLPPEERARQLQQVDALLRLHGDVSVFRPGSGWFTPRLLRQGSEMGYRCVLGSPWLLVTEYDTDPQRQGRRLAARAHPGAVAVLHEGTRARTPVAVTADALLTALADRGSRSVTVRELLGARSR